MIKNVYFDRNVFDHIRKRCEVTDAQIYALRNSVSTGCISILLSIQIVEETLPVLNASPDIAKEELQLILDLTDSKRLIKYHTELLSDHVVAYAQGKPIPQPFIHQSMNLEALLNPKRKDREALLGVINETHQHKEDFQNAMQYAKQNDSALLKSQLGGKQLSFGEYYEAFAATFAEDLADRFGVLSQCKERGIPRMLQIRSIQLYVGSSISLSYAQIYEGHSPRMGDSRDMHHAVLSSAADAFVTHDNELARRLSRINVEGFHVLNIRTLLEKIQ